MILIPLKCQTIYAKIIVCGWLWSVASVKHAVFACFSPWRAKRMCALTTPVISAAKPRPLQQSGRSDADSGEMWDPICHVEFPQSGLWSPELLWGIFCLGDAGQTGGERASCAVGRRSLWGAGPGGRGAGGDKRAAWKGPGQPSRHRGGAASPRAAARVASPRWL